MKQIARLASSYRTYPPETVQTVRFIKQSQELGYTLAEIKQLLSLRDKQFANSKEVRLLAQAKLCEIEDKIKRFQQVYEELSRILNDCECGEVIMRCPVLDTLNHSPR